MEQGVGQVPTVESMESDDDQTLPDAEAAASAEDEAYVEDKEGTVKDLSGDGGLVKKIIKKGEGWRKPDKGAEVEVHYVGRLLDGTVFDSSRDRNVPFKFRLGLGEVIKGWDKGLASMLKGELSLLTCKPDYAYGASGSPPKIPPNATLEFEVELLSWTEERDLTDKKDQGVMKKILKEGQGWDTPKDEARVKVHLVGRLPDGTIFHDTRSTGEPLAFVIGEETCIEGLEKTVESMKQAEHCEVRIAPQYAYGAQGNAAINIPPHTPLHYDVELLEMTKAKESWDMSGPERLEAALKRKDDGNELYKNNKVKRAMKKYKRAISFLDAEHGLSDNEKTKAKELKVPLHLNMAACKLVTKEWADVKEHCNKALEIDNHSARALVRRAKAEIELDDWDTAEKDLVRVLESDQNNADAKKELARIKKLRHEQNAKEKKLFSNMFAKLSKLEEKEQPPPPPVSAKGKEKEITSDAQ